MKISKLMELYILILIILNTSLTKMGYRFLGYFASTHHITILTALSSLLLAVICNVYRPIRSKISVYCGFLDKISLYILFVSFAEIIYTAAKYDLFLSEFIFVLYPYLFVLLSYPLLYIAVCGEQNLQEMMKAILICTLLSFLLRWIVAGVYNQTGQTILPTLATEYASDGWIRNGRLRINPPCFIISIIPLAVYVSSKSSRWLERAFCGFIIGISICYTLFVHQARSVMMYLLFSLVMYYLFKRKSPIKKIISVFVIFSALFILLQTDYTQNLIRSFTVNSHNQYSSSTSLRLESIRYYSKLFSENPWLGIGALWMSNEKALPILRSSTGKCCLEDIGLLGGVFRFGILGAGIYILIFLRMVQQIRSMYKSCLLEEEKLLLVGLFVSKAVFSINIDCFFGLVAFSYPFDMILFEYYGSKKRKKT